jgi:3-oxo-4,17-pregnadiene-20-carboxyl-CoA hydratase beta subunit
MKKTRRFEDVKVGEELPPLDVPTTASLVVGGAIASRDFTPVHHDKAAAQAQGLPDVFMNILTTNGFVGRYVTDWAGPDALLRGIKSKLGGPNMPGDTLKIRGKVEQAQDGVVAIRVDGNNSWGSHVSATVTVELPRK